jgi:hypothetical protein
MDLVVDDASISQADSAGFALQGKLIGEKFRALTPEEKVKYDELSAKDKKRYEKEMAAYQQKQKGSDDSQQKQKGGGDSDGVDEDQDSDDSDSD